MRNLEENIEIFGDELTYFKNKEKIILNKNVKINFKKNIFFNTEKVYMTKKKSININSFSNFKDKFGNKVSSKKSKFLLIKKLLKIKSVKMIDEFKK